MRACENCAWGRGPDGAEPPIGAANLECREGPMTVQVFRHHWCGRFRVAERLTGGRDVRGKS